MEILVTIWIIGATYYLVLCLNQIEFLSGDTVVTRLAVCMTVLLVVYMVWWLLFLIHIRSNMNNGRSTYLPGS